MFETVDVKAAIAMDRQQPLPKTAFVNVLETLARDDEIEFGRKLEELSCSGGASGKRCHMEMVRDILIAHPDFARTPRSSDGSYPLHIAAQIGNVFLGCLIASVYPAASIAQSFKGKTPLHVAAREGHADFVAMLLRLNPSSAQVATEKLKLPLHFAASEGQTQICCQLLEVFPAGAALKSTKGKLPLHLACRRGFTETTLKLLSVYPEGSESLDWECATPLNLAIMDGREDVATHLIDQCPNTLKVQNINDELPLDIAIRNTSSFRLFSKMVKTWPEGCKSVLLNIGDEEDTQHWSWGKIELCLMAVSGLIQSNTVQVDLASSEDCQVESHKYLPLHTTLELTSNVTLIKRVIQTCPDLICEKDSLGRLPLHIAVQHSNTDSKGYVKHILNLYPNAATERDNEGRLPLHVALTNQCDISIVKALLIANPKSAVEKCTFLEGSLKGIPPLFLALQNNCSIDTIFILTRYDPTICPLACV